MGRIERHFLDNGFSVVYDDGSKEKFTKNLLDDNYSGDRGSKINSNYLDNGFTVYKYDGTSERFHKNFFNDNLTGDSGTHIDKNFLNDNYHTYNYQTHGNGDNQKLDLSWMDRDQHVNNFIGLLATIANIFLGLLLSLGGIRIIVSSIIIFCLVAGNLDTVKDIKKKKYKKAILIEDTIGDVIMSVVFIPIYLLLLFA